ncbi:MAG: efflux transporter outer membrane subunit [Proteobacteria bacterium]|nr:efflux transporter outer membrane subunit [Pseudomonadota bacterium]
MRQGRWMRIVGTLALSALGGCAVGPSYRTPGTTLPDHFAAQAAVAATAAPAAVPVELAAWWRGFNDPELDSLVDRAVKANPDIGIALARLQAAREVAIGSFSTLLPFGGASAGGGRGTGSDLARGRASQSLVSAESGSGLTQVNLLAGFDAAWQLDFFGKYRREIEAARADAQAAAAARNEVLVAVIAQVVRDYADLRGLQMRSGVLHSAIDVLTQSLDIVKERYRRGITNELDVTLAQRELETLRAQVAPLDAQLEAAKYALATLLGQYPEDLLDELSPRGALPIVLPQMASGLPVDLLRRRPDIQVAERELAASTARIGVAAADLFPSVAVSASVGFEHQGWGATPASLSQHIWSVGPGAAWPLLDFGALDARLQVANYQTHALLLNYKKTIQGAVQEVDTVLDAYRAQQQSLTDLAGALTASRRAVELANERYDRGLTDFLNVVDAQRAEYQIEDAYAQSQVLACEDFAALYRALGGGWQNYQDLPPVAKPLPAVVAAFREVLTRNPALRDP